MGSRYPQQTLQLLCKRTRRALPKDTSESCTVGGGGTTQAEGQDLGSRGNLASSGLLGLWRSHGREKWGNTEVRMDLSRT